MKNLEFKLTAIDEASGVVAAASKRISDSLNEVSKSQNQCSPMQQRKQLLHYQLVSRCSLKMLDPLFS